MPRPALEIDAETGAHARLAAAERAAETEGRALADLLGITNRHRSLAALPADTGAEAATRAAAVGGVDRHVQHRRAHRTLAIDALVLFRQPQADVVVELGELVVERLHVAVGVAVGARQRL